MTTEDEHRQAIERVESAVASLGEHFDAVQIFVSKFGNPDDTCGQKTFTGQRGSGNYCARYGQIREWVIYQEERIRLSARETEA